MLTIHNVCAGYGNLQVLFDINLAVEEGEAVCLLGPNGAGKSTLFRTLSGLIRIWQGSVNFLEEKLASSPEEIVSHGLIQVPEGREVFPNLTVYENLELGTFWWGGKPANEKKERMEKIYQLFPRLFERRKQLAGSLSGGEQQMLALGRGFLQKPRLLLLDEPSLGVAPIFVDKIFEALHQWKKEGLSLLIVEQSVETVLELADRGYVIQNGQIIYSGTQNELRNSSLIRELFFGVY